MYYWYDLEIETEPFAVVPSKFAAKCNISKIDIKTNFVYQMLV